MSRIPTFKNPSVPAARRRTLLALAVAAALPLGAQAQGKPDVKIALIASKTGPLEAYAKQTIVGFNMGLEYATGGTMTVAGRKLVVIEKDDQGKPDVGKAQLAAAYADDKVDIATIEQEWRGHRPMPGRDLAGGRSPRPKLRSSSPLAHADRVRPGRRANFPKYARPSHCPEHWSRDRRQRLSTSRPRRR